MFSHRVKLESGGGSPFKIRNNSKSNAVFLPHPDCVLEIIYIKTVSNIESYCYCTHHAQNVAMIATCWQDIITSLCVGVTALWSPLGYFMSRGIKIHQCRSS
ncbi:hypothetical protein CRENBAI_008155 [Crenichthys baileyi]|uniref:Uncharacterized protein n=1 Tax=Crenichthys baileyi TaxID=28760 RepID=A0AAV9SFA9_9TELE